MRRRGRMWDSDVEGGYSEGGGDVIVCFDLQNLKWCAESGRLVSWV